MKRTQIYLSEEQHEVLRRMAFEERKSISQVIRDLIDRACGTNSESQAQSSSPGDGSDLHAEVHESVQAEEPSLQVEQAKRAAESLRGLVSEEKYEQLTTALEEYRKSLKKLTKYSKNDMPS